MNAAVLHVKWSRGDQWIPINAARSTIYIGSGPEPGVRVPLYHPTDPRGGELVVWVRGEEMPALTLLPAGPSLEVDGVHYPVRRAFGTLYVDADKFGDQGAGLALLATHGLDLDGAELGADGLSDTAVAREYVASWDPGLTLSAEERDEAVATIAAALPTLRQMAGGAS